MRRYAQILGVLLRASLQTAIAYRADFVVGGVMALFWISWNLVPSVVAWNARPTVAGWSFPEALVVIALFVMLKGMLEGAISPSLLAVVEHIRKGTLDFILVKPADAQFLVSTAKFNLWRVVDVMGGFALLLYAFTRLGRWPAASEILAGLMLLVGAVAVLYSLSVLVVSTAFWVVKVDNLAYLFNSIFDAARWPATVFRGFWRMLFTFVIPLALMTTYPALALIGKLSFSTAAMAFGGAALFACVARLVWLRALGRYTSASS